MPTGAQTAEDKEVAEKDAPRRLVVELGVQGANELADLVKLDGLNKTTIVNRALRLYALIRETDREGGAVYIKESGTAEMHRILMF